MPDGSVLLRVSLLPGRIRRASQTRAPVVPKQLSLPLLTSRALSRRTRTRWPRHSPAGHVPPPLGFRTCPRSSRWHKKTLGHACPGSRNTQQSALLAGGCGGALSLEVTLWRVSPSGPAWCLLPARARVRCRLLHAEWASCRHRPSRDFAPASFVSAGSSGPGEPASYAWGAAGPQHLARGVRGRVAESAGGKRLKGPQGQARLSGRHF